MENNYKDEQNSMLVAIFVDIEDLDICLQALVNKFKIVGNKIFILSIVDDDEYVLTFNIETDNKENLLVENIGKVIRIHRRKETNTLYTINALNYVNKTNQEIDWNKYKFSFLTVSHNNLKIIKTKLLKIHTIQ